jgi:hypothetical protein
MNLSKVSTDQLLTNIEFVALSALAGEESKAADELCDASHDELRKRQEARGEYVRISNLTKNYFGKKAYICTIEVDGLSTSSFYESDLEKAKGYRRRK